MMRMGLAPCAPFNVTQDLMVAAAKLARQHEGVRLHTHLAENIEDIEYMEKTFKCRPGEYIRLVARVFYFVPDAPAVSCLSALVQTVDMFCTDPAQLSATAQHSTTQHSTAPHSIAQHRKVHVQEL